MITGFEDFAAGTIRLATPLLLAATGELVVQRSGVINIGIEGTMLLGAFTAFAVSADTGSPVLGLMAALFLALLTGAVFAYCCISRKADQIVTGAGINLAMVGMTGVLYRSLFAVDSSALSKTFSELPIPLLSELPLAGPGLFSQSWLFYAAILVAFGVWMYLVSPYGLSLKACGIYPEAADTAGIRVDVTRFLAVLFGSLMAGAGGAFLTLVQTNSFAEEMTNGRGFIALAIVIFGRWSPVGAGLAAVIFGAASQAQFWFQARGGELALFGITLSVPYQFWLALPYIVTLVALAVNPGRYRGPKALGQPFVRSS